MCCQNVSVEEKIGKDVNIIIYSLNILFSNNVSISSSYLCCLE